MNYINFERKYVSNGIAGSIEILFAFGNIKMDQYAKLNSI